MQTIAYVHGPVTGHAVLPVLACELRVLSRDGILGPVLIEGLPPLEKFKKEAYREYALAVGHEGTAFQRPDLEARVRHLHEAITHNLAAIRMKPSEKLFSEDGQNPYYRWFVGGTS